MLVQDPYTIQNFVLMTLNPLESDISKDQHLD